MRRLLCNNPSPFTFKGTVSYIVGRGEVAIVDPGPDDDRPCRGAARRRARRDRHAYLRHPHPSRSFAGSAARQGGDRRHRAGRGAASRRASAQYRRGAAGSKPATTPISAPTTRSPTARWSAGAGWTIEAVATPGHTANHMAYALQGGQSAVLRRSRDGVGDLGGGAARRRDERLHGLARQARARAQSRSICPAMAAPCATRRASCGTTSSIGKAREASILHRLGKGAADIPTLVRAIYIGLDPRLVRRRGAVGARPSRGPGARRGPLTVRPRPRALPCDRSGASHAIYRHSLFASPHLF